MWVYDIPTLQILDVNAAAIERYGYSRLEFLALTIRDLRPLEDVPKFLELLPDTRNSDRTMASQVEGREHHSGPDHVA